MATTLPPVDLKSKLQELTDEENNALEMLLDANGYSRDQLFSNPEQIVHIEMFLHEYPKMSGMQFFPFIKSICLIHQGIKEIACLENCVNLEKLWIVENEIKVIQGLDNLRNLKELYLYSNRIGRIENLGQLTNLEVLWLADNLIKNIEDIAPLVRLRELNLARNDIFTIGDALAPHTALEILNLADNPIGSFKEVRPLMRLPRLVELCFADPMWGECPLALLCNYQTYVLFMLPKLASLDTLLLAEETKHLAEATFLKKQMYYNMRIKTMHRNARNIIKLANEGRKIRYQLRRPLVSGLVMQQKDIARELEEAEHYGPGTPGPGGEPRVSGEVCDALKTKLEDINTRLAAYSKEAGEAETYFEECASCTYQVVDAHVSRMLLELETAGNIRLEDGKPTDLWYSSCVDLVMSRFNPADYDPSLGVTGLHVVNVTRVHNRWLRNRFEKQLTSVVDTSDSSYKKSMEYLFLGEHPVVPGDMDSVIESGLRPASALGALGLDAAVPLSNNMHLADQLRLHAVVEARMLALSGNEAAAQAAQSGLRMEQPAIGRIMIVKVYLGKTQTDSSPVCSTRFTPSGPKMFNKEGKLLVAGCMEGPRIEQRQFPEGTDAVSRTRNGDNKQRCWYVFDHVMILPEYLVEFQYELAPTSVKLARTQALSSSQPLELPLNSNTMTSIVNSLEPDLRPLARPLMSWLALHFDPASAQKLCGGGAEQAEVQALLDSPPQVAARPKALTMTDDALGKHLNVRGSELELETEGSDKFRTRQHTPRCFWCWDGQD